MIRAFDAFSLPLLRWFDPEDAHRMAIQGLRLLPPMRPRPDDPKLAVLLRSYADEARTLTQTGAVKSQSLRIGFSQNPPSPPAPIAVLIPIVGDDLDFAHATLPPRMHIAAWKR